MSSYERGRFQAPFFYTIVMKRVISVFIFIIGLIAFCIPAFASSDDPYDLENYLVLEENVQQETIEETKKYWSYIPNHFKDTLIHHNIKIVLCAGENGCEKHWPEQVKNLYGVYYRNRIYLDDGHFSPAVIAHEAGHALDQYFGYPSTTKQFKEIVEKEGFYVSASRDPEEVWADAFQALTFRIKDGGNGGMYYRQLEHAKELVRYINDVFCGWKPKDQNSRRPSECEDLEYIDYMLGSTFRDKCEMIMLQTLRLTSFSIRSAIRDFEYESKLHTNCEECY